MSARVSKVQRGIPPMQATVRAARCGVPSAGVGTRGSIDQGPQSLFSLARTLEVVAADLEDLVS